MSMYELQRSEGKIQETIFLDCSFDPMQEHSTQQGKKWFLLGSCKLTQVLVTK